MNQMEQSSEFCQVEWCVMCGIVCCSEKVNNFDTSNDTRILEAEKQSELCALIRFKFCKVFSSERYCSGGDFIKEDEGEIKGPAMPRSIAILAQRTASMITPAELGESQTSSFSSKFRGTSPKARPSIRM